MPTCVQIKTIEWIVHLNIDKLDFKHNFENREIFYFWVVRSHTLGETNFCFWESHKNVGGISTGTGEFHAYGMASVPCTRGGDKPDKGTFSLINAFFNIFQSLENFESIDYAVYKAGQLGLKLIVPLTGKFMNQNTNIL